MPGHGASAMRRSLRIYGRPVLVGKDPHGTCVAGCRQASSGGPDPQGPAFISGRAGGLPIKYQVDRMGGLAGYRLRSTTFCIYVSWT